jgi:hypothetical protein
LKAGAIAKTLAATFVAFLFVIAFPVNAAAAPAFTSVSVDRTTVMQGQSISITVRATAQTHFVFAVVDGTRTQGTRVSAHANDWVITLVPSRTATVNIFANSTNTEHGAATMSVPITVTGATPTTPTTPSTPANIPPAPANLGAIDIASVTETPAIQAGAVQLTVVTGIEATEVWVNFDRVNNQRGSGRFARGTMITQGTHYRIWTLNFIPNAWAVQQVEIGSNRTYNWPGADTRLVSLTLTQPFVQPVTPVIQNVTVSPRTVAHGGTTTFTIRTNADVENVWVRDVDGREHEARRTTTTAAARNWTVTFNPLRTGNVIVFANANRTTTGAVQRTENVSVGFVNASIISANATWLSGNDIRINATTGREAATVWVTLADGRRVQLHETTTTATGNRTWETWASNVPAGNMVVSVSSQVGNINALSADDTRTVNWSGHHQGGGGVIFGITHSNPANPPINRGSSVTFHVRTAVHVDNLVVGTTTHGHVTNIHRGDAINNERLWTIHVSIPHNAPVTNHAVWNVTAVAGGSHLATLSTPVTVIV